MSFWPFPKTLLAELEEAQRSGPVIELGCGHGDLLARLAEAGIAAIGVEILPSHGPPSPWIRGDVRELPLADGAVGGFVIGDLARHLDLASRRRMAEEVDRALAEAGRVIFLEDAVEARDAAEENYRETIRLLSAADPRRGVIRPLDELAAPFFDRFGAPRCRGVDANTELVREPMSPFDWIEERAPQLRSGTAALRSRVREHGMRYGLFAWCSFARSAVGTTAR